MRLTLGMTSSLPPGVLYISLLPSVSLQETFIRAQVWLKELERHYVPGSTVIWLVGNKGDLAEDRQVSAQVRMTKTHLSPTACLKQF